MSVKKSNNTVSVVSNGATVKKPKVAGVTNEGIPGIPATGQQPAVGLTGGGYAENIERYYVNGNSFGSGAGSSPVGSPVDSLAPASSLAGSSSAGKSLTGGLYGQNLDRYFDSNVVGKAGSGIGGGTSGGGVTDEGVIVGGNTGNLEKFPTVGNGGGNMGSRLPSSGVQSGLPGSAGSVKREVTPDVLKKLQDQIKQQETNDTLDRVHAAQEAQKEREEQNRTDTETPSVGEPSVGAESEQTPSVPSDVENGNQEQSPPPAASTTPTESGGNAESPTGSKGSSEPMTYEEYIEQAKKGYQAQLEAAKKQAELTRQRAVVDAQSSYMQNLASYGANAEQMADAGMRGGGYSDYLNAQAYAQKRSDVQQANAQAAYENQAAEGTYQDYINGLNQQLAQKALEDQRLADQRAYEQKQIEDERLYQQEILKEQRQYEKESLEDQRRYEQGQTESERQYQKELLEDQRKYEEEQYQRQKDESKNQQRDSLYGDLWQGVLDPNSNYTPEAIDDFAREYGLSEQQATSLKNLLSATKAASQAKTEKEKSESLLAAALDAIETSGSALSDNFLESLKMLGLSDADYAKAKEVFQKNRYDAYSAQIREANATNGMFDTGAVDESYKNGALTDQQYNDLKSAWNSDIDKSESLFFDGTEYYSKDTATQILNSIIGNSWCSAETRSAVQAMYDKLYTPVQKGVSFNNNGGGASYSAGDNFSIKDEDGFIYRIQSGGEVRDENIYDIASDVKDGQVFGYNGKIYFKTGQKIYIVEKRDNSYGDHWDKLYKKFFG